MRKASFMFLLVCSMLVSTPAQQGIPGGSETVIRALEHEWFDGQSRNNNRALDLIFDNALVYVEYGKLVSKGEYLSRIKWSGPQVSQIVLEAMTVHLFETTAIVIGTYRETSGKSAKVQRLRWRFVDTWVYEKNGWVLVAAASAPLSE
jgi:hypothetical protein